MRRCTLPALLLTVLVALPVVGCTADNANKDDEPDPTVLNSEHPGWRATDCEGAGCHALPVTTTTLADHDETESDRCAICHGGNGAVNPNGAYSTRWHLPTDVCLNCHSSNHGYTESGSCLRCHMAPGGLAD